MFFQTVRIPPPGWLKNICHSTNDHGIVDGIAEESADEIRTYLNYKELNTWGHEPSRACILTDLRFHVRMKIVPFD